jgi:S1-C subfamily serine protease
VISLDHNINNGYIVDEVSIGSTAEKLGIRNGDVIVSLDGLCVQTLPQFEDYLLSWLGFLAGKH